MDIGLYLHIPFCSSFCPYCAFYKEHFSEKAAFEYSEKLQNDIYKWSKKLKRKAKTLYIGGGTPSVMPRGELYKIINAAREAFLINGEITVEANPKTCTDSFLNEISSAGANRLSLGLQSAVTSERKKLGRFGGYELVKNAVFNAKKYGFSNISLDIMLGVPMQTRETLAETMQFACSLPINHISCYILELCEGTFYYKNQNKLDLPDDEKTAELYLFMVDFLIKNGFSQYEISNFCRDNAFSSHNLIYWNGEQYLGLGPSAHSFIDGKRFYFKEDINSYINDEPFEDEGFGGDFAEYAMLRLRLVEGLNESDTKSRFGFEIPKSLMRRAAELSEKDLVVTDGKKISLTSKGFLLSNSVIAELLEDI